MTEQQRRRLILLARKCVASSCYGPLVAWVDAYAVRPLDVKLGVDAESFMAEMDIASTLITESAKRISAKPMTAWQGVKRLVWGSAS